MLQTFAHAGHSHSMEATLGVSTSDIDHCMPIIIGAGAIIAALLGVIVYLLVSQSNKNNTSSVQKKNTKD